MNSDEKAARDQELLTDELHLEGEIRDIALKLYVTRDWSLSDAFLGAEMFVELSNSRKQAILNKER